MKRLLLISTSFPDAAYHPGQEAAGQFVYDLARELAHHVSVGAVVPGNRACTEQEGHLTVYRFRVPTLPLSLLKPANPADWPKVLLTLSSGQKAVSSASASYSPDHIVALWSLPSGYWAKKTRVPYAIWALGSDIWEFGRIPVLRGLLQRVLREATVRFADGHQLAKDVEAIGGKPCYFLPSSRRLIVGARRALVGQPPYNLAFLGRWHPNKGADLLMESLQQLRDDDWGRVREVRIYGGGPLEPVVTEGVRRLQAQSRPVTLGGYLGRKEATDLLSWADYLILPSRIESIPVIFSDALQTDTPLIATPVGDLPRLLADAPAGILAKGTTAGHLAEAIRNALTRSPRDFQKGIAALRAQFDVHSTAVRLLEAIRFASAGEKRTGS